MEEVVLTQVSKDNSAQETAAAIYKYMQSIQFLEIPSMLLLSGGSCIDVAKALVYLLPNDLDLSQLVIALSDERDVELGSDDSNEQQLRKAGVITAFENLGAKYISLLAEKRESIEKANAVYEKNIKAAQKIILLAGMGADGHTAGILPHPTAESFSIFSQDSYVTSYTIPKESDNPFKIRITFTFATLAFIDTVFLYVTGEEKLPALKTLVTKNKALHELPALGLYLSQQLLQICTTLEL